MSKYDTWYHLEYSDYCLHSHFYSQNVSADVSFSLLQFFIFELRSQHRTSNCDLKEHLYTFFFGRCHLFHFPRPVSTGILMVSVKIGTQASFLFLRSCFSWPFPLSLFYIVIQVIFLVGTLINLLSPSIR